MIRGGAEVYPFVVSPRTNGRLCLRFKGKTLKVVRYASTVDEAGRIIVNLYNPPYRTVQRVKKFFVEMWAERPNREP